MPATLNCGQAQLGSLVVTDTDGATVTFDVTQSAIHQVTLAGNRTLAVTGDALVNHFYVALVQDATGSRTVTWWAGIKWAGGSAPTLTTAANKTDLMEFWRVGAASYIGKVAAANA